MRHERFYCALPHVCHCWIATAPSLLRNSTLRVSRLGLPVLDHLSERYLVPPPPVPFSALILSRPLDFLLLAPPPRPGSPSHPTLPWTAAPTVAATAATAGVADMDQTAPHIMMRWEQYTDRKFEWGVAQSGASLALMGLLVAVFPKVLGCIHPSSMHSPIHPASYYPSIYICAFTCLSVHPSISSYPCSSVHPSIHPSIHPPVTGIESFFKADMIWCGMVRHGMISNDIVSCRTILCMSPNMMPV